MGETAPGRNQHHYSSVPRHAAGRFQRVAESFQSVSLAAPFVDQRPDYRASRLQETSFRRIGSARTVLRYCRSYPEPTPGFRQGTNNFVQARPTEADQRKETISIDWNPSDRHQVRGRIQNYNFIETSAFRAGTDRAPQIIDRPNNTASISWTFTISPTLVNEFLATSSADRVHIYVDTRGDKYQRSNYGINYPYLFPVGKEITDKIPTVEIQNFATRGWRSLSSSFVRTDL